MALSDRGVVFSGLLVGGVGGVGGVVLLVSSATPHLVALVAESVQAPGAPMVMRAQKVTARRIGVMARSF